MSKTSEAAVAQAQRQFVATKCQCRHEDCPHHKFGHLSDQPEHPFRVVVSYDNRPEVGSREYHDVMCAACAEWEGNQS